MDGRHDVREREVHVRALLLLPVLLCAALSACAGVPGVTPSVRGVEPRFAGLDLGGVDMAFDIKVSNPLLKALHAPRYSYSLDVSGRTLASGHAAAGADFPAAGVGVVTIPARVEYDVLAAAYGDLEGATEVPYVLSGSFAVPLFGSKIDVPFEHSGLVPVVRPPTIDFVAVDTSGLTRLGGKITVEALLHNPNAFALSIADAGYALELGGERIAALQAGTGGSVAPGAERKLSLVGRLSLVDAAKNLVKSGGDFLGGRVVPTGSVGTPFGPLRLGE